MKKIALVLALIMLMTVALPAMFIGAAGPLDSFTKVEKPESDTIRKTSFRIARTWGVENPVGQWDPNAYETWQFNSSGTFVDSNNAAIILWYNDYDRRTLTEIVFADIFTSSGQGDYGRSRVSAETWDKVTLVVSDDFLNWREVDFTVAYHTETPVSTQNQFGQSVTIDLYWHMILEEATTAKYFAIHGGEEKAWDADDHAPKLGIMMDLNFFYGVNTSGQEDVDFDEVRYLYVNEAHTSGTVQSFAENADGTLTLTGFAPQSAQIWHTVVYNGTTKNFPYVSYAAPVSANEMVIADRTGWADESKTAPKYTDYEDLEIYYADEMTGTWKKIETTVVPYNCQQELRGGWAQGFRFQFAETVTAKCFLFYDPNPQANEIEVTGNTFYAVFDPANGTGSRPETQAPESTNAPETEPETTVAPETEPVTTVAPETDPEGTKAPETAPVTTDSADAPAENDVPWLYIVIASALVVAVAIVIVMLAKKKK